MQFVVILAEIFFSYYLTVRLADEFFARNLIFSDTKKHINTIFIVWIVICAALFSDQRLYFSVFLWSAVILLTLYPRILLKIRSQRFRDDISVLINQLVLKMRLGQSFRSAFKDSLSYVSPQSRFQFEKIYESLVHKSSLGFEASKEDSQEVKRLLHFFEVIDASTHNSIQKLINFRELLHQERHFRSRVTRALSQVYAQASILLLLYMGLFAIVVVRFGFKNNARLIVISVLLSVIGHIWALKLGKGFRWKV